MKTGKDADKTEISDANTLTTTHQRDKIIKTMVAARVVHSRMHAQVDV